MPTATHASTAAAPIGKPLPPEIQKAMAKVNDIGSLPEITTKIVQVVEDTRSTAHDMHEIVKTDPALAAKILKVVNSAFYGLPSQIASLDRAIIMLGLSAVKNIALAASLSRLFKFEALSEQFAARDLWRHCNAVGVCARLIAQTGRATPPDEAFVGGLVHDMGLLVEQQMFGGKLKQVAERCFATGEKFVAVENEVIGADHEAFGASLATKWKFPPSLRNAIAHHHDPTVLQPEFRKYTTVIYLADTICCQQQHGFWLTAQKQEMFDPFLELVNIKPADVEQIVVQLPAAVDEAERIFSE